MPSTAIVEWIDATDEAIAVALTKRFHCMVLAQMAKLGLLGRAFMGPMVAIIVSAASSNDRGVVIQIATASVFHALSAHSLATGLTTQTTGSVEKDEQGALLGLEHSLFSLARIAGPSLGTMLLARESNGGFWYVAICCAAVDLALVIGLLVQKHSKHKPC